MPLAVQGHASPSDKYASSKDSAHENISHLGWLQQCQVLKQERLINHIPVCTPLGVAYERDETPMISCIALPVAATSDLATFYFRQPSWARY